MPVLTHTVELDEYVFSHILSFIFDSHTIYTILHAIPMSNPLFFEALNRICQLPIHLSSEEMTATIDILDRLLPSPDASPESALTLMSVVNAIRHLIITLTPDALPVYERLAKLLRMTQNIRILDWRGSFVPLALSGDPGVLQVSKQFKTLCLDASAGETHRT
jgi:hypothetical protein